MSKEKTNRGNNCAKEESNLGGPAHRKRSKTTELDLHSCLFDLVRLIVRMEEVFFFIDYYAFWAGLRVCLTVPVQPSGSAPIDG